MLKLACICVNAYMVDVCVYTRVCVCVCVCVYMLLLQRCYQHDEGKPLAWSVYKYVSRSVDQLAI